jgi:alkylated DNA repair dioxygenase AlkB
MGLGFKLTIRKSTVVVSCPLVATHVFDVQQTKAERIAHHAVTGTRDWIVLSGPARGRFTELTIQAPDPDGAWQALGNAGIAPKGAV